MPHRKRILLSDDNEGFSTLLLESLHEHGGFHVLHAREEHEVMETIQCHKPQDRKSTRLNSSHKVQSRMPSSA